MKMRSWSFVLCLLAAALAPQLAWGQDDFAAWLEEFKGEATAAGISPATLAAAFDGVAPLEEIIELDRRQPEFTQTFWGYIDGRVTPQRVERGRKLLVQYRPLLKKIRARYGVQPGFLVAFWGLETNFGDFMGKTPVIASLATLAYDRRRSDFFRKQLLDAVRMIDGGHANLVDMRGSWAGAMGQLQFMPDTFMRYAVDGDGDGRRDIWRSYPDAFASAANYLTSIGWQSSERWGREVRLPRGFDLSLADLAVEKSLAEWRKLGVRRANGRTLPRARMSGSIVLPGGAKGPAFLVYRNFRNIMVWNRSLLYALAVGYLSDRIIGLGQLRAKRPAHERPLRREEVEELQMLLTGLGFDPGEPDGIVGSRTRAALRAYQQYANLPADGYPTIGVLEGLRQKSGN
jgi:membrane-bound lytic murein transglycosylase B